MRCVATLLVLAMALAACETNPEPQAAEEDLSALLSETTSLSETVDEPATSIPVTTTTERPEAGSVDGWTTLPEAPIDPRSNVGSVWTGEEFIVWGGGRTRSNPTGYASDGAAYNPETGEWRVLAESPLTGRLWNIMEVIDGEVLVLGGDTGFADDGGASGAFYNPETDTWREIASAPNDATIWSSYAWTGEELLVEGHTYADPPDPASVLMVYDPESDSWSVRPVPDNIGTTWVNDRWFGWTARPPSNEPQGPLRGFAYLPGTDEVEQLPAAPIPTREMQSTIWTGEEIIVVAGYGPLGRMSDGAAYNPATKEWREIAPMPIEGRVWNYTLWSGSEVLIFGGAAGASGGHEEYLDGAAYHPETDTWRLLPNLPTSAGGAAVYAPDHGVILWTTSGGFMLDAETIERQPDGPTTTQIPAEVVPTDPGPLEARFGHSVVWTGSEMIVWGGHRRALDDTFDDGAALDPSTGEWRRIAPSPLDGMTWHFAAWSGNEMLIVGISGAAAYDPVDDVWRRLSTPPIQVHRVSEGTTSDITEYAWSGSRLYLWNPIFDEFARFDPVHNAWEELKGPGLNVFPAKIVAGKSRVVVFGTRWPSGLAEPATNELFGAELIDGDWVDLTTIDFGSNVPDPGTATLVGELVLVWGDASSTEPARLLHPDGTWTSVPPPPIDENMLHPEPVRLDDGRVLALSEGGRAGIWEPEQLGWTPVGRFPKVVTGREAVWTEKEVVAWTGNEAWRWDPPPR